MVAVCDVTDSDAVRRFFEAAIARFGHVDVLVNDAGTMLVGPLVDMDVADFHSVMKVNFFGALNTMFAVIPHMRARKSGRIVNIASIGGLVPVPHLAAYVASKFALVGFSQTARAELAQDGISVVTINPGLMRTGSPENVTFKGDHRAEYAWFAVSDSTPFLSMSAEEAAAGGDRRRHRGWDRLGRADHPIPDRRTYVCPIPGRRRRGVVDRSRAAAARWGKRAPFGARLTSESRS